MKSRHLFFFLFAIAFYLPGFAQQNFTLYNMQRIPQSMYANPALMPLSSINIGLPGISSIYMNVSNSGFRLKDILVTTAEDSLKISPDNLIAKLASNNYLTAAAQVDLLSFGFRLKKKHYISFNATEKVLVSFRYPKDFLNFVWKGNGGADMLGKELQFNFGIDAIHYRQYGLGYAIQLMDNKLTLGTRLNYFYGMENVWTELSSTSLTTDATTFDITAKSNLLINTSGLDSNLAGKQSGISNYLLKNGNHGFGADFGVNYKINERISVSGSINDLGFIHWKSNLINYVSTNSDASYTYQGIALQNFIKDTSSVRDGLKQMVDSVKGVFNIEQKNDAYTTRFSPQIYAGGNFHLTDRVNFGLLYYSTFFDKRYHPGLSLSANTMLGRIFSLSATYSIYNRSYNNVGLGFSLNGGPVQWYLVSDNVAGMIFPVSTKNLNLRAGINLTIGKGTDKERASKNPSARHLKKEKSAKKSDEPNAVKASSGPADSDKDGVLDDDDMCPDEAGRLVFHGCPDMDDDSIPDLLDSCPDIAGTILLHGCPDTDKDGVEDRLDKCPTDSGSVAAGGCPDKDKDGVADMNDACPDQAGGVNAKGCPDKDNDGVTDEDDECPTQAGLKKFLGCPDTDADGIPDSSDGCPTVAGTAEKAGCP